MTEEIKSPKEIEEVEEVTLSNLFEINLDRFLDEITALNDTLPMQLMILDFKHDKFLKDLEKFSTKTEEVDEDGNEFFRYKVRPEASGKFPLLHKQINRTEIAKKIIPRNFIVSIISQFDAYIGELIRVLYVVNPNIIKSSDKQINADELFNFETIDELKEHIIDKEVDTILREEHLEQLKMLEKRITSVTGKDFTLTSNLPILADFVELTQRRNLFVHTNGTISRQYVETSKKWNFKIEKEIKVNDELDAPIEYCNKAFEILFEMSVKLTHVLWRKFLPTDRVESDEHLNMVIFELLNDNNYSLAITIANFSTDVIKKFSSEQLRKFVVINKAIAYKFIGKQKECDNVIKNEDWTIGNEFKLAKLVLEDNFDEARKLMLKIGDSDDLIDKKAYKNWPLFTEFRKNKVFQDTYLEIFQEEFTLEEIQDKKKEIKKDSKKAQTFELETEDVETEDIGVEYVEAEEVKTEDVNS